MNPNTDLKTMCCDALGYRSEIQQQLDILNQIGGILFPPAGGQLVQPTGADILAAVKALVQPTRISADDVPPTDTSAAYWVWKPDSPAARLCQLSEGWTPDQNMWQDNSNWNDFPLAGTQYLIINRPGDM